MFCVAQPNDLSLTKTTPGDPGQVREEEVVDPGDTGQPAPTTEE